MKTIYMKNTVEFKGTVSKDVHMGWKTTTQTSLQVALILGDAIAQVQTAVNM
jgi:hypothetical protein